MSHDQKNRTLGIAEHRAMQLAIFKALELRIEAFGWIGKNGKLKHWAARPVLEHLMGVFNACETLGITPALISFTSLIRMSRESDPLAQIRTQVAWLEKASSNDAVADVAA